MRRDRGVRPYAIDALMADGIRSLVAAATDA
jgi:hypothetical protein